MAEIKKSVRWLKWLQGCIWLRGKNRQKCCKVAMLQMISKKRRKRLTLEKGDGTVTLVVGLRLSSRALQRWLMVDRRSGTPAADVAGGYDFLHPNSNIYGLHCSLTSKK